MGDAELPRGEGKELPSWPEHGLVSWLVGGTRLVEANENTVGIKIGFKLRHLHLLHPVSVGIIRVFAP
jgi:hypothetical protein